MKNFLFSILSVFVAASAFAADCSINLSATKLSDAEKQLIAPMLTEKGLKICDQETGCELNVEVAAEKTTAFASKITLSVKKNEAEVAQGLGKAAMGDDRRLRALYEALKTMKPCKEMSK